MQVLFFCQHVVNRTAYLHVVVAGVIEYTGVGNPDEYTVEREHDVVDDGETDEKK